MVQPKYTQFKTGQSYLSKTGKNKCEIEKKIHDPLPGYANSVLAKKPIDGLS